MSSLIHLTLLALLFSATAQASAPRVGFPARFQPCERKGDSFEWIATAFSPAEWALSCLNSPFVKIYKESNGKVVLKEYIRKNTVRATFYEGESKTSAAMGPEIRFFLSAKNQCGSKLGLNAALLVRNRESYVEKFTGICTEVPDTELEKGSPFLMVPIADVGAFKDYDQDQYLLALTRDTPDMVSVRAEYPEHVYDNVAKTRFLKEFYLENKAIVGSLTKPFNCGNILTGARYLPGSQKLLLNWITNLSVLDFSNAQHFIHDDFVRNKESVCPTVGYRFGYDGMVKQVIISSQKRKLSYTDSTAVTQVFDY